MALLYGIASSVSKGERLVNLGVPYVQLRIKSGLRGADIQRIHGWEAAKKGVRLVINDSIAQGMAVEAWGVHLGQADLQRYQSQELCSVKLRLGISVHNASEWKQAQRFKPALVGFGPIFHSLSKRVPYALCGIAGLRKFLKLASCPVVAIGGIQPENVIPVADSGVELIAMLSGLNDLSDLQIKNLMQEIARPRDATL